MNCHQRYRLLPRVLQDVSARDLGASVLGGRHRVSMPIGISPTAMQRMAHPEGEVAAARAAQAGWQLNYLLNNTK